MRRTARRSGSWTRFPLRRDSCTPTPRQPSRRTCSTTSTGTRRAQASSRSSASSRFLTTCPGEVPLGMADKPDFIVVSRDRDLAGRRNEVWVRHGVLGVLAVISLLGLLNVFGQKASNSEAAAEPAALEVHAPTGVRAGLLYSARFTVRATETLDDAALVFDSSWVEGMQVNTTTFGHRDASVQLVDGDEPILTLHRTLTIYP